MIMDGGTSPYLEHAEARWGKPPNSATCIGATRKDSHVKSEVKKESCSIFYQKLDRVIPAILPTN